VREAGGRCGTEIVPEKGRAYLQRHRHPPAPIEFQPGTQFTVETDIGVSGVERKAVYRQLNRWFHVYLDRWTSHFRIGNKRVNSRPY
jgi:hypothetical protein